jgi:hypothetical protein
MLPHLSVVSKNEHFKITNKPWITKVAQITRCTGCPSDATSLAISIYLCTQTKKHPPSWADILRDEQKDPLLAIKDTYPHI